MKPIMYQKILLAILILLGALRVIAGILNSPRLAKACLIGAVLVIAGALIVWVLMGLSPIPPFVFKLWRWLVGLFHSGVAEVKQL